uniref:CCHC-type domain-containing protein n=1 Tax=Amphimedon queenslandica TaxID=400682 RepID=A0A1X7T5Z3_AMPQE
MQSDERITEAMQKALDHRSLVKKEREYYKDVLKEAQLLLKGLYTDAANNYNPPLTMPLAMLNIVAHYSFDYAQQVHYPSSPLQAGPIYFLTPRKCGIFGVCCEAIPQQVNFLIDESFDTGKGANPVISMVHFYLKNHGLNSVSIHFHADNCTGQNKNNTVIQYLLWRVMTGLNASISISFLPVGHTKFSPDWCFGLLKQKFRKAEVDSLDDFIQVVEQSSAVNKAQPVGSSNGELIVETLDWCSYFATLFKKIKGIKGFQHFVVNATSPGVVAARQAVDGPVTQFNLLKEDAEITEDELPNILPPKGMSTERKWYLYEKIRPFCRYECKDVTCPLPDAPRLTGSSRQSTPGVDDPTDLAMEIEVPHSPRQSLEPPATQRKCGNCGQFGHNRRTCP